MDCKLFYAFGAQEEKAVLPNTVNVLGTLSSNHLADPVRQEFTQKGFVAEHIQL